MRACYLRMLQVSCDQPFPAPEAWDCCRGLHPTVTMVTTLEWLSSKDAEPQYACLQSAKPSSMLCCGEVHADCISAIAHIMQLQHDEH